MATVYLGYDPRFRRDVAIKVLPRQFTHDRTFRARFALEAQTIGALEHPAIVPVHDFGEEDGQPYLVMRYMPGGSLAERLGHGPLPLNDIVRIMDRLASALDRAHQLGIIHRDLKPGNILFDQYDDAYLADFGIAKMAEATAALTGSGLIGTPSYMSPEQVKGEDVDGRSDIYTLGVILFEMLTGQQPYEAKTPIALAFKHVHEPIPVLRTRKADLAPGLQETINQAMSKTVQERFQTARELATSVKSASQGSVTAAPPPPARPLPTPASTEQLTRPDEAAVSGTRPKLPVWVWAVTAVAVLALAVWGVAGLAGDGNDGGGETAVPTFALIEVEVATPTTENTPVIAALPSATSNPSPTSPPPNMPTDTAVAATATPEPTATCVPPRVRVSLSSANVRHGPGLAYEVVGVVYQNDSLTIIAQTSAGSWYNVEFGDQTGWISAIVVELVTVTGCDVIPVAATIPVPPSPTFTPTPLPTDTPQPAKPAKPPSNPYPSAPTPIPP